MSEANGKPVVADGGGHGAAPAPSAADAGNSARQYGEKDVLAFLKETTGRDFPNIDEAAKSVKSLNAMVGDQAVAELRKSADLGKTFDKALKAYAKQQGVSEEEAKSDFLALVKGDENGSGADPAADVSELKKDVGSVKERLDQADLIAAHPEASHVLGDVKDLAKARGLSLEEAYKSSAALQAAAKGIAATKAKEARPSSPGPSGRLAPNMNGKDFESALSAFKEKRTGANAEALVATALGLKP